MPDRKARLTALLSAALLSGCSEPAPSSSSPSPQPNTPPTPGDIGAGYKKRYHRMTRDPVPVNPGFSTLCINISRTPGGVTPAQAGPHANTSILIYMNDPAAGAFRARAAAYPAGSVIVKEKNLSPFAGGGMPGHPDITGVGGMIKRAPEYDSAHGDWEYFYIEPSGKIESGRLSSCVDCHSSVKDTDYVFGAWNRKRG